MSKNVTVFIEDSKLSYKQNDNTRKSILLSSSMTASFLTGAAVCTECMNTTTRNEWVSNHFKREVAIENSKYKLLV